MANVPAGIKAFADRGGELPDEPPHLADAAGVDSSLRNNDRDELPLLLRLRFRLRVDLGLGEDDYDRLLDTKAKTPRPRPAVP